MSQPAGNWFLMAVVAGMLAACASSEDKPVEPNLLPTNYKQEIIDTLSRTLGYPTNVREAFISDPALAPVGKDQRYTACVRYNARDASNRYAGSTDRIAYFYGGHLNQLIQASKEQCGNAAYKPFPELEKLCLATKCE
jgi:hypothetical protein